MNLEKLHVALSYEGPISMVSIEEFKEEVATSGLELLVEERPSTRAFAGIEWVMPTAVMVYIAKSYFDGFLGEMGKDHYQALKSGIRTLQGRLSYIKINLVGTPGKVSRVQPYSLVYSVWSDRDANSRFKFLVPNDLSSADADRATDVFMTFLEAYHRGVLEEEDLKILAEARPIGRTILLAYEPTLGTIQVVDPLASIRGD